MLVAGNNIIYETNNINQKGMEWKKEEAVIESSGIDSYETHWLANDWFYCQYVLDVFLCHSIPLKNSVQLHWISLNSVDAIQCILDPPTG